MGKGKKEISMGSSVLSPFTWCFFGSSAGDEGENARGSKAVPTLTGPEATMVAAAKHFSAAHKVRYN